MLDLPLGQRWSRVATAADLVTFCCSTEPLGRAERSSSEPADLAGMLNASCLFGTTHTPTAALLLVVLQLETSWQICSQCGGLGVLPCRTAEEKESRKVLSGIGLWKSSKVRWSVT